MVRPGRGTGLLNRITADTSKYSQLVFSLSPEIADRVADVVQPPLGDVLYQRLKAVILDRTIASERARLQQLLTAEELGDRRPSQMLHRMRQLMGERVVDSQAPIPRELFLQRVPQSVRLVLAAAEDVTPERLASLAERVDEAASPTIAAVSAPVQPDNVAARLESHIEELAASVAAL